QAEAGRKAQARSRARQGSSRPQLARHCEGPLGRSRPFSTGYGDEAIRFRNAIWIATRSFSSDHHFGPDPLARNGDGEEGGQNKRQSMKICVAGQGAFGQKHLDALKRIPEVEVTSLVGGNQDATAEVAKKYGIPHHTGDLSEGIKRADAVILTT